MGPHILVEDITARVMQNPTVILILGQQHDVQATIDLALKTNAHEFGIAKGDRVSD